MPFRFIPPEEQFLDDFVTLAEQIRVGASLLEEMLAPVHPLWSKADEVRDVEHKCDRLTREIIHRLHRTFITPIDREDIYALARSLDDVMDAIDASASFVRLYRIASVRSEARSLAGTIAASVDHVVLAVKAIANGSSIGKPAAEIHRLEAEADGIHQGAIRLLFDEEPDPMIIIKWKEILDSLEQTTDRSHDVANVIQRVAIKNPRTTHL